MAYSTVQVPAQKSPTKGGLYTNQKNLNKLSRDYDLSMKQRNISSTNEIINSMTVGSVASNFKFSKDQFSGGQGHRQLKKPGMSGTTVYLTEQIR